MKNNTKIIIALIVVVVMIIGVFVYYQNSKPLIVKENTPTITENSIKGCYVAHLAKDIYTLEIQSENNENVSGILAYNNFEKDSSSGTFSGTFFENILLGNYSFDSEGMRSDRQVIFKKIGNDFVQGFGPTKVVDNKEILDLPNITFDPNSTFIKSLDCTENFTDSNNVFSFDYDPYFRAIAGQNKLGTDWRLNVKPKGILLARVLIPKTYMPITNFSEANLTIGRSTDADAIKTCTTDTTNGEVKDGSKTINGYTFTKFILSDAGAGNLYETTSYRGIVDGDCYALEYTIHSTNIGNYSPDQGIKEFDKSKIQDELEKIIGSFKFLINSK